MNSNKLTIVALLFTAGLLYSIKNNYPIEVIQSLLTTSLVFAGLLICSGD
jgi:hypothetical protein